jgi:hypothetical protein
MVPAGFMTSVWYASSFVTHATPCDEKDQAAEGGLQFKGLNMQPPIDHYLVLRIKPALIS